jgi:ATP-dependent RNA helicase DeaD
MERVADLHKAEHKREEHERREKTHVRREERRRDGGDGEGRRGREDGGRERGGRGEREERGRGRRDRGRREREAEPVAEPTPEAAPATEGGAGSVQAVEVPAYDDSVAPREAGDRPGRGRIFLSLGEVDGADEARVREVVAGLAPALELLKVEVRRTHSFLEVAPDAVDGAVAAIHGRPYGEKALTAERARRRRR